MRDTCRNDMGIEFDGWQDGMGKLMLAQKANGKLAHTVGGFGLSAMRQIGKTYFGAGALFGMCQHYPGLLVIWTAHHGKALDCNTELLTTNRGWVTMGTAQVGDEVLHPSGRATVITGVSDVMLSHDCFEVTTTDGRTVIADAEHLWTVTDKWRKLSSGSGANRKRWLAPPETVTTAELYRRGMGCTGVVKTRGKEYRTGKYRFLMPTQECITDLPARELPIDPYLFGAWLGDGASKAPKITCASEDLIHWSRAIGQAGYLAVARKPVDRAWNISIRCAGNAGMFSRSFTGKLKQLGVYDNKHIPENYLLGSVEQRVALLQGLMDTDGTINKEGTAYFTSSLRDLSEGVMFLARSLGWRASFKERKSSLKGVEYLPVWQVTFTPNRCDQFAPFRLDRKLIRIRDMAGNHGRHSFSIKSVQPVATRPVRCIKVAEDDGLFLAGRDLIPTHNTSAETFLAMQDFAGRSRIAPFIDYVHTGSGDEEVAFHNGSRILFGARERGFGRGIPGVDVLVADEGQILSEKAMRAMIATLNTSWLGLHIYFGTPPEPENNSETWMRMRKAAWDAGPDEQVEVKVKHHVWVEVRAPPPPAYLDDFEQWGNPSFPHRTPLESMMRLREMLSDEGVRREGMGLYDKDDGSIFDIARWNTLDVEDAEEPDRAALVLDVSPDRKWSALGIVGNLKLNSLDEVERPLMLVKSMKGTSGVVAEIVKLNEERDLIDIAITNGAARALEGDLTKAGVEFEKLTQSEMSASYGTLQRAIKDGVIAHVDQPELNLALANARSRYLQTGEAESFDRREYTVDISPAVSGACALYRWGLLDEPMPYLG